MLETRLAGLVVVSAGYVRLEMPAADGGNGAKAQRLQPAHTDTDNDDSTRLALAAPSAGLGSHPLVQGPNGTQRRSSAQDDDRGVGAKLLVALWKYVSAGVVIEGAMMRAALR
jgi:hypothetical protein